MKKIISTGAICPLWFGCLVKISVTVISLSLLCVTALAQAGGQPATAGSSHKKPTTIGVMFSGLSSWGIGRWPEGEFGLTLDDLEKEILAELKEKSSASKKKLEVIKVQSVEEARTQGIEVVYSVDYREERGDWKTTDIAIGNTTLISCTFTRADNTTIATNWDDLKISELGKDFDAKVERKPGELTVSFTFEGKFAEGMMRNLIFGQFRDAIPVLKFTPKRKPK